MPSRRDYGHGERFYLPVTELRPAWELWELPWREGERRAVTEIQAFVTAHEDELFEADYRAMLEFELARKKPRSTVVKGLKALIGEE